ncbi:unnamed protein product [Gadus morhua 'NCC']
MCEQEIKSSSGETLVSRGPPVRSERWRADRAPISHFDVSLCGFHGDVVAVLPLKRKRRADEPSGQQHSAGWRHGLNSFTLRLSCACSPTPHRHGNQLPDPIQGILDLDVDL